jgi:uncharacterized membrane protein
VDALFDTAFGLPVHALVVHAAVVLVPLAAIGAVMMVLRSSFSRRFGSLVVVIAGIAAISAFVAKESGEALAQRVGNPEQHAQLGDVMPLVAGAFFVLLLVFWLFDRGIPANRTRPGWLIALGVLLIAAAAFTIFWTVRVGHTGAEAVWSSVIDSTTTKGSSSD